MLESIKAVIYCRVSDPRQATEGHGLNSQATRCREYAKRGDYEVLAVFEDDISGSITTRIGMDAMLAFIRQHKSQNIRVIIDDITRLARDVHIHWELREAIKSVGGKMESPSLQFGEDADSILVENLLASVSQHQRQKNAEQVKNRMRSRLLNGFWAFPAPVGYKFQKTKSLGKLIVPNEKLAPTIAQAIESYASGQLLTQLDVASFLASKPEFPHHGNESKLAYMAPLILRNPLYAGHLEYPKWEVDLRPAQHEAIISLETYFKVQKLLAERANKTYSSIPWMDFPLKRFVSCSCCGNELRAAWAKGRSKSYAYYFCANKGCTEHRKSIKKEDIEGRFQELLANIKVPNATSKLVSKMFYDVWNKYLSDTSISKKSIEVKIAETEMTLSGLCKRVITTSSDTLTSAFEDEIKKLEREKLTLKDKLSKCGCVDLDFENHLSQAMELIQNPQKWWDSEDDYKKRSLFSLAFDDKLQYDRLEGFRTAPISLPFRAAQQFCNRKSKMVDIDSIETNQILEWFNGVKMLWR